jgi:hypothetical protein
MATSRGTIKRFQAKWKCRNDEKVELSQQASPLKTSGPYSVASSRALQRRDGVGSRDDACELAIEIGQRHGVDLLGGVRVAGRPHPIECPDAGESGFIPAAARAATPRTR